VGLRLYEKTLRIPLILYVPGFRPQRFSEYVVESDIAPTVLKLMGLGFPKSFHGTPIPSGRWFHSGKQDSLLRGAGFGRGAKFKVLLMTAYS